MSGCSLPYGQPYHISKHQQTADIVSPNYNQYYSGFYQSSAKFQDYRRSYGSGYYGQYISSPFYRSSTMMSPYQMDTGVVDDYSGDCSNSGGSSTSSSPPCGTEMELNGKSPCAPTKAMENKVFHISSAACRLATGDQEYFSCSQPRDVQNVGSTIEQPSSWRVGMQNIKTLNKNKGWCMFYCRLIKLIKCFGYP